MAGIARCGRFAVMTGRHQAVFSPDGRRVASAGEDGTVAVMDGQGVGRRIVLQAKDVPIREWTSARRERGSPPGPRRRHILARADAGGGPRILRGHGAPVSALDFGPDGSRIVSGDITGKIRIWDLASDSGE